MSYSKIYENLLMSHAFLPYYLGNGRAFSPIRVQIELTGRCNLNCAFCYQGKSYKEGKNELNFEEVIRIIDQAPRYALLTLSGGEPLLKERINEILGYALRKHYCNIITNGVLLNQDISKIMVKKRLMLLNISIDGVGELHDELRGVPGAFTKIRENILFLKEYKKMNKSKFPLIDVKTVVTKKNISQLLALYNFCKEIEADFLTISLPKNNDIQFNGTKLYDDLSNDIFYHDYPFNPDFDFLKLNQTIEMIDRNRGVVKIRFYPRFEDYNLMDGYFRGTDNKRDFYYLSCMEPWSGFQISAKGKAYPCLAYCVGDCRKQSIGEIWNSEQFVNFRRRLKKFKLFPSCLGCCYLKVRKIK